MSLNLKEVLPKRVKVLDYNFFDKLLYLSSIYWRVKFYVKEVDSQNGIPNKLLIKDDPMCSYYEDIVSQLKCMKNAESCAYELVTEGDAMDYQTILIENKKVYVLDVPTEEEIPLGYVDFNCDRFCLSATHLNFIRDLSLQNEGILFLWELPNKYNEFPETCIISSREILGKVNSAIVNYTKDFDDSIDAYAIFLDEAKRSFSYESFIIVWNGILIRRI